MAENEYDLFYERLIADLRETLPQAVQDRQPDFEKRSNRLRIKVTGITGVHYEMCFRQDYHEFALHFESTPEISLSRREAIDPYLETMSLSLNYYVQSGPLENKGWMRGPVRATPIQTSRATL